MPHQVVLREFPGPGGVVLWQTLQDVVLYASVAPDERGPGLFRDDPPGWGEFFPDVRADLETLWVEVRGARPEGGATVAAACRRIAGWAEGGGFMGTALEFVQAAALADRGSPAHAFETARLARLRDDLARATVWFRRANVLARRAGEWRTQALSFHELAKLLAHFGSAARAQVFRVQAYRAARRHGLHDVRATVALELARHHFERGELAAANTLAREAVQVHEPDQGPLPAVARTVAECWMSHQGAFGPALDVLREAVGHVSTRAELFPLLVSLTRAAAGAGDPELFEIGWMEVWLHLEPEEARGLMAEVLVDVARAAAALGESAKAESAARQALRAATEQGNRVTAERARAVLAEVEDGERGEMAAPHSRAPELPETEELVKTLLAALRKLPRSEDPGIVALAAALAAPTDPKAAYDVGRRARCAAEYTRAEGWYRRALGLGKAAGDWEVCVRAICGIANVHRQRGNLTLAVSFFEKAIGVAREYRLSEMEGFSLFGLAAAYFEMEEGERGIVAARDAVRAYGSRHPAIEKIAHDLGAYFMNSGDYANALAIFRTLAHCPYSPAETLLLRANTARAAAGVGDLLLFERAWSDARQVITRMGSDQENHAVAMGSLAHAALLAGKIVWAEQIVRRALEVGEVRKETFAIHLAEEVLAAIKQFKAKGTGPRQIPEPLHSPETAKVVTGEVVTALEVCTASRRRSMHTRRKGPED
jgi:tetratricopeptide (TPR) repeat protein